MYIVEWCDHEGNLHEREFTTLLEAYMEAAYLMRKYDGVEIKEATL